MLHTKPLGKSSANCVMVMKEWWLSGVDSWVKQSASTLPLSERHWLQLVLLRNSIHTFMVFLIHLLLIIIHSHLAEASRIQGKGCCSLFVLFSTVKFHVKSTKRAVNILMEICYHGNLHIILRSPWLKHAPLLLILKTQMEDPQLTSLKLQLQNGTALHDCPTGRRAYQ